MEDCISHVLVKGWVITPYKNDSWRILVRFCSSLPHANVSHCCLVVYCCLMVMDGERILNYSLNSPPQFLPDSSIYLWLQSTVSHMESVCLPSRMHDGVFVPGS